MCGTGNVLIDGNQLRNALACDEGGTHRVAGGLRGHHDDVEILAGFDLTEVDVEAVGKRERRTFADAGKDLFVIDLGNRFVRDQHHNDVRGLHGVFDRRHGKARGLSFFPGSAVFADAHDDVNAGIVQVLSVGVALAAVPDDGDLLRLDEREVSVLIVENFHDDSFVKRKSK